LSYATMCGDSSAQKISVMMIQIMSSDLVEARADYGFDTRIIPGGVGVLAEVTEGWNFASAEERRGMKHVGRDAGP